MRQMQGGKGGAMGFGKSKAKLLTEAHGRVTFKDVAGVDEAKVERSGTRSAIIKENRSKGQLMAPKANSCT